MLTRLGAHDAVLAWEERRMRREVRATANRLANFDDANLRRSARAAVAAGARVQRALEILGDDVPEHLREAGDACAWSTSRPPRGTRRSWPTRR
jgi:DNA-binding protein WhiA